MRERTSMVTAGDSDSFGVRLLLKARTIDSGREKVVKSKEETAEPGRRLPAGRIEGKCREEGITGSVNRWTQ